MLLPYLQDTGTEAEVLCVDPNQVASPQDDWLAEGLPEIPIHRAQALGLGCSFIPGLGTLTFRALNALKKAGDLLLGNKRFDLIYFSTTVFGIHILGPRWKKRFGTPYFMDYQDPWVSDYYNQHPEVTPPGGRIKYAIANWLSRKQEPKVLQHCSGITSVSTGYPDQLCNRYQGTRIPACGTNEYDLLQFSTLKAEIASLVIPFPGDPLDLDTVSHSLTIKQSIFTPNDGLTHWVYVGRGGEDMAFAVRSLFTSIRHLRKDSTFLREKLASLRMHFIGTSYAADGQGSKTIEPLAAEYGLEDIVFEHTDRIPYSEALRCLLDADALIVPGSDDPSYTASKIYPYLLAKKPLLAIFHENSSVTSLIRRVGGGHVVSFESNDSVDLVADKILKIPRFKNLKPVPVVLDDNSFAPYSAKSQAHQLTGFFRHVLAHKHRASNE